MNNISGHTITKKYEALEDLPSNSIECSLMYCGKENCEPGHAYGPVIRHHYMMFIITNGNGFFRSDTQRWDLSAGHVFSIFPGENIYFEASVTNPWSFVFMGFNGTNVSEYLTNAGLTIEHPTRKLYEVESYKPLIDNMLAAHELTFANSLRRNAYLFMVLSNLMDDYKTHSLAGKSYDYQTSVYVKHTVNYLAENYQKKIQISDIADYIGISRNYLSICFKNEMGISPHEYLTRLRIEKAQNLLKNTNLSIQAISTLVGYTDSLAFSRIFKKKTNLSPKEYRNSKNELQIARIRDEYVARSK
ncbi:MAG: AraC family transcriptional regulator [Oliverpabstia sp.]